MIFALATWAVSLAGAPDFRALQSKQNPAAAALISILDFPNKLIYSEKRVAGVNDVNRRWGYLSSTAMGVAFAAGWMLCIGPILADLFLGMSSQTVWQSAALLLIYSAGLGIPIPLTGAAFGSMSKWLRAQPACGCLSA